MKRSTPTPTHTEHSIPCPGIDELCPTVSCIMHITYDTGDVLNSHAAHARWRRLLAASYLDDGDAPVAAAERRVGE